MKTQMCKQKYSVMLFSQMMDCIEDFVAVMEDNMKAALNQIEQRLESLEKQAPLVSFIRTLFIFQV